MRKRIIGIALLAILSLALFSQIALAVNVTYVRVVRGQEVTINLGTRTISANAGLFGIKIGSVTYYGYCIDIFHRAGTGSASLEAPPDTGEWEDEYQSIAYIMAWYTPTPPTSISDFEAASVQAAIWRFLFPPPLGVISPSSVVNRAIDIYDDAFGKDAIRGTSLELTFDTSSYPPNIDVIAQIDQLRDGVKIIFSATGGTLSDTVAFTDSFGTAKVTLSPPSPWTGPITVTAYTMGIKNFKIVNMVSDTRQDLIIGEPFKVSDSESIIPLAEVFSIYGYKFYDENKDGIKNLGEGLEGWTIELWNATTNEIIATNTTNADGYYEFTGLVAGSYKVKEVPKPGWVHVTPEEVSVEIVETDQQVDFRNIPVYEISGYKFHDMNNNTIFDGADVRLPGWTIQLWNSSGLLEEIKTNGTGYYKFTGLEAGAYKVKEILEPGWKNTTLMEIEVVLPGLGNGNVSDVNFGNIQILYKISGFKFHDINNNTIFDVNNGEPGIQGWEIQLLNATTGALLETATTDSNGFYNFTGLEAGTYMVREVLQTSWKNTTLIEVEVVVPGDDGDVVVNFGNIKLFKISGYKFHDMNNNTIFDGADVRLPGWTIQLWNETQTEIIATTITNGTGYFEFTGLRAGTYIVKEVLQTGWKNTTLIEVTVVVPGPDGDVVVNFGNVLVFKIWGFKFYDANNSTIFDGNEVGLEGWIIQLWNSTHMLAQTTTNGTGYYEFMGLQAGNYIVKEILQNGWTNTTLIEVPIVVPDPISNGDVRVDFGNLPVLRIYGYKFNDKNANKIFDGDDVRLEGWIIQLWNENQTIKIAETTTNSTGYYEFLNVKPGTYIVKEVLQNGWVNTTLIEVDVEVVNVNIEVNFGNTRVYRIFGYKFNDKNSNGTFDGNDVRLPGWTIQLWNATHMLEEATTNSTGYYQFVGLKAGPYIVKEILQNGWVNTTLIEVPVVVPSLDNNGDVIVNFGNKEEETPPDLEGTIGFWRNWNRHNTYTKAQIDGWLAIIHSASNWLMPSGYSADTDGMVKLIKDATGKGSTMEKKFLAQYLALRLNVESLRIHPTAYTHDVTALDPSNYLGLADPSSATVSEIIAAIEGKYGTSPTGAQFEIMKNICDALNNLWI